VQGASLLFQVFAQPVEVSVIVFLAKEAGFTVVSALNDVQRNAIEVYTGAMGHMRTLTEIFEPGPLILFNPQALLFSLLAKDCNLVIFKQAYGKVRFVCSCQCINRCAN
jgi:hypothetical protein